AGDPRQQPDHTGRGPEAGRPPAAIAEAFHVASTGRPGPVLVDIPKDVLQSPMTWRDWPPAMELPGYRVPGAPDPERIREAARLLRQGGRPVLYVGGGGIKAGGHGELRALAQRGRAAVTARRRDGGRFPAC